jgi:hypothetical protein
VASENDDKVYSSYVIFQRDFPSEFDILTSYFSRVKVIPRFVGPTPDRDVERRQCPSKHYLRGCDSIHKKLFTHAPWPGTSSNIWHRGCPSGGSSGGSTVSGVVDASHSPVLKCVLGRGILCHYHRAKPFSRLHLERGVERFFAERPHTTWAVRSAGLLGGLEPSSSKTEDN